MAHEIGHYRLPGHIDAVLNAQGRHFSKAGFRSTDRYEQEADQFASALLMPAEALRCRCGSRRRRAPSDRDASSEVRNVP